MARSDDNCQTKGVGWLKWMTERYRRTKKIIKHIFAIRGWKIEIADPQSLNKAHRNSFRQHQVNTQFSFRTAMYL